MAPVAPATTRWVRREVVVALDLPAASHPAVSHPHLSPELVARGNRLLAARLGALALEGWVPVTGTGSDLLALWRAGSVRWRALPASGLRGAPAFRLEDARLWVKHSSG